MESHSFDLHEADRQHVDPRADPRMLYGYFPSSSVGAAGANMSMFPMFSDGQKRELLRKGKWTPEEEAYANRVIEAFNSCTLRLEGMEGVTLRTFLSNKLGCDPMRITKKYTGASCLGKKVYHGTENRSVPEEEITQTMQEIESLEHKFREKLEQMRREKRDLLSLPEVADQYVTSPAIDALLMIQNRGMGMPQVVPPWAYGPSQAAMVMQSYLNYANSLPLTAYVAATTRQLGKEGPRSKKAGSDESSSNNTNGAVVKSSEGSDSSSDSASTGDSGGNDGAPNQLPVLPTIPMANGVPYSYTEFGRSQYPLNAKLHQQYHYTENERLMHAFGAGYNHSSAMYMAQQAQANALESSSGGTPKRQHEKVQSSAGSESSPSMAKKSKTESTDIDDAPVSQEDQTAASSLLGLCHQTGKSNSNSQNNKNENTMAS